MSENCRPSILSQIIIGVTVTVIGAVLVDKIKTNASDELPQDKSASRSVNRPDYASPSNSGDNQSGKQRPGTSPLPDPQSHSVAKTDKPKEEDYSSYINPSQERTNVSVIIVEADGSISNSTATAIAEVYQKKGKSTSVGLIRSAFVRKPEFQELCDGNSAIIQKLNLSPYTDYLAVGKISFAKRSGSLVGGTIVCTASISMNIISINSYLVKSFTISNASGNGATESQAQEDALQKLLDRYYNDHSTL